MKGLIRPGRPVITLDSRQPRVMLLTLGDTTVSMDRATAERFAIEVLTTAQQGFMEPERKAATK